MTLLGESNMEVQPIHINLNTSTDEESENETSLCVQQLEPTPSTNDYPDNTDAIYSATAPVVPVDEDLSTICRILTPPPSLQQQQPYLYPVTEFVPVLPATGTTYEQEVYDYPPDTRNLLENVDMSLQPIMYTVGYPDFSGYPAYAAAPTFGQTYVPDAPFQGFGEVYPSSSTALANSTASETALALLKPNPDPSVEDLGTSYLNPSLSEMTISSVNAESVYQDFTSSSEFQPCIFPTMLLSSAGLLTVLLKHEVAVEITLDRAIRVVNNRHKAVAATSNRGNASAIHHPAAKVFQEGTTTEADIFWDRKAKITSGKMLFSCGESCFQLAENGMQVAPREFNDLSNDMTITILYSSSGYGPHLVANYEEMIANATYRYHKNGAISVKVNGMKIHQSASGDVTVTAGRKYIKASPVYGSMYIETPFIEMAVEMNWNVKIRRGACRVHASFAGIAVSDRFRECGFDQFQQVFIQPISSRLQSNYRNGMSSWAGNNHCNYDGPRGDYYDNTYNDYYHGNYHPSYQNNYNSYNRTYRPRGRYNNQNNRRQGQRNRHRPVHDSGSVENNRFATNSVSSLSQHSGLEQTE